jgi:HicB-like protein involved in pilus formation
MSEPSKGSDLRTIAVRVSPDFHAQLSMVAQVDGISLTDLMMMALQGHVEARRQAEDFQTKVKGALADEEARIARTKAMLLGGVAADAGGSEPATGDVPGDVSTSAPASGRARRKDEASR